MAECPYCQKEIEVPMVALRNAETYGANTVATLCCGRGVRVAPVTSFKFYAYEPESGEDEWGVRFKKPANQ